MGKVTGTTFIRNAFKGGFPLFESMAAVLSIVDEFYLLDMGSDDGTLQMCEEIAAKNKRIKIIKEKWSTTTDASAFADVANRCVDLCPTEGVLFYQADEIFHEDLLTEFAKAYEAGEYALTVERIQLSHGFQRVKWLPHAICRSVIKGKYTFVNDGMSVGNTGGCKHMCPFPIVDGHPLSGKPNTARAFPWHEPVPGKQFDGKDPKALNAEMARVFPWNHFLVDTSSCFRDSQIDKKALHAPFWRESPDIIDGKHKSNFIHEAMTEPDWTMKICPFPLPNIAKGLVGMTRYTLRDEVRTALENDDYSKVLHG